MNPLRILMIAILFLFINPLQSDALSCAELEEPAIEHYDLAVVGTVLDMKKGIAEKGLSGTKEIYNYVLLQIEQSWKQEVDSQIMIQTDFTWGHPFKEGEDYLLYLNEKGGQYFNSPCSTVSEVHSTQDYEPLLGEGLAPVNEVDLRYQMWWLAAKKYKFLFVLLILGAVLIWIGRRVKKRRS